MLAGPETLPHEESAYRAIFEASSDGLVINDAATGVVLEANPAFCQMHGYQHMAGLHPTTFIHPTSHHLFEDYLRTVREGGVFRARAQDVRRDGTVFDVEVLGRGFVYHGQFALLGVVRDVTEQVRAYQDLEERVAARTREIERRRQVAEGLRELLGVVNSKRSLDEILDYVLAQAGRLLASDAEALHLLDEADPSTLRLHASRNVPEAANAPDVPNGTPVMGLACARQRPVVVPDFGRVISQPFAASVDEQVVDRGTYLEVVRPGPGSFDDRVQQHRNETTAEQFRTVLAVPVVGRDQPYGALTLLYREERVPSDEELAVIATFGNQAGLAIESARLHRRAERRLHELEALYRADQALHRSLQLDDVLQALCDLAVEILQAEKTTVWTWDPRHRRIVVAAGRNISPRFRATSFSPDDVAVHELVSTEVVVVEDIQHAAGLSPAVRETIEGEGVRAWVSATIRIADQVFGSFSVGYAQPRRFSDRERRLVLALAQWAELAIDNARLYQQSEQRRQEIEALYHADEQIYGSLRFDEVLQALIDVASRLLQPDKVSVGIWDERTERISVGAARGFSPATVAAVLPPAEARLLRQHLSAGIVAIEDAQTDPRLPPSVIEVNRREQVRSSLTAPIRLGTAVLGAFGLSYCEPRTFDHDDQRLLAALAQRAALALANARLHEESEQRRHELEGLYEADAALHRSLRLQDVLEALVDAAKDLLQADGAGLWGPDPRQPERIIPLAARGLSDEYLETTMVLTEEPAIRDLWWSHETLTTEDVLADPRFPPAQRAALVREGYHSLLSTQVRMADQVFGSFSVGFRQPRPFSETEQRLLSALAQRAGLAIQNARLYEQAQQAATLEERQRLARELHDAVTQTLFSTALIAEVLPDLWRADPDEGRKRLAELRRLTRGALAEMRTLLIELRPGALTELPLGDLLRQLGEAVAGRTRLEVTSSVEGAPVALPPGVQVAVYRIAQEALNNVVKHAQARQAMLSLAYQPDGGLRLRVADDGRGLPAGPAAVASPTKGPAGHLGLSIMRERADAIGAHLTLHSRPGGGTAVDVSWHPTPGGLDPR